MFPWVFNIADTMLLTGMGLLILHMHRNEKRLKAASSNVATPMTADNNQPMLP